MGQTTIRSGGRNAPVWCICLTDHFFRGLALILLFISMWQELLFFSFFLYYIFPSSLVIRVRTGESCCFSCLAFVPSYLGTSILFFGESFHAHSQSRWFRWSDSMGDSRGGKWPRLGHQNIPPHWAQWLFMVKYTTQSQQPKTFVGHVEMRIPLLLK